MDFLLDTFMTSLISLKSRGFSYDFNFALYVGGNLQKNGVKIHFTLHMVSCSTKYPRIDSRLHKLSFSHVIWGKYVLHTCGIGQAAGICGK